ncbi:hypothetical protein ACLB2K_011729 [Fragaria x ananassa]
MIPKPFSCLGPKMPTGLKHMPLLSLIYTTSLRSLPSSKAEEHAKLRHNAAELLFVTGEFDLASSCFERATDLLSKIGIDTISDAGGEKKLFLDLSIARSKTDWEVSNQNLVVALLNRATSLLFGSPEHYKTLVNQYSVFGNSREGTAGAETAKGVFLGQRCHVSASAAVRVSHRVLRESCSEGSKVRAKVVSSLYLMTEWWLSSLVRLLLSRGLQCMLCFGIVYDVFSSSPPPLLLSSHKQSIKLAANLAWIHLRRRPNEEARLLLFYVVHKTLGKFQIRFAGYSTN